MFLGNGSSLQDLRRLRSYRESISVVSKGWTRSTDHYPLPDYAVDAVVRHVLAAIDQFTYSYVNEQDILWDHVAVVRARYAELCLQQADTCLHMQLWLDAADPWSYARDMLCGAGLADVNHAPAKVRDEAELRVAQRFPIYEQAVVFAGACAGVPGAPAPPSDHPTLLYPQLYETFCLFTEIAIELLRARLEALERAQKLGLIASSDRPPQNQWPDDDRPRSDAEAAALTRRQSGETLIDGLGRDARDRWERSPREIELPRVGLHESIERAIYGGTGEEQRLALAADDPTVCLIKRRAKLQHWFRTPSATTSYQYAFSKTAVRRLYNGVALANRQGLVLNVRLGVSWYNVPGCAAADCGSYFAQFKKNLVQWFAANGLAAPYPALVFVHERADRAGSDRFHTHLLMAVPEVRRAPFMRYVRDALLRVLKRQDLPKGPLANK